MLWWPDVGKMRLFNKTFKTDYYTHSLNGRLIFSVHKPGKKENPNNLRGITLSNCLGKLFSTILYNRLITNLQNANILSPAQDWFRKHHRTSDHVLNLFSLLKKTCHKEQISIYLLCWFSESVQSNLERRNEGKTRKWHQWEICRHN